MGQNIKASALSFAVLTLARQTFIHTMRAYLMVLFNILQRKFFITSNLKISAWVQ